MANVCETKDILTDVSALMAEVNADLAGGDPYKFNRTVRDLVLRAIENGKTSASFWRYMNPGTHSYTATENFPKAIYENLSKDFLDQLEGLGISIYPREEADSAVIRVTYHF